MAKAASMLHFAGLLAIVTLLSLSEAQESITCETVVQHVSSCVDFLKEPNMKKPSQACCNGAQDLHNKKRSENDRIDVCNCIKQALTSVGQYDPERMAQLPKACGLSFNVPAIDKNTDCKK